MRVNFNRPFTDYSGNVIAGGNMAEQLCIALFNLSKIKDTPASPDQKYMAFRLCLRIQEHPEAVEITHEESMLIKDVSNDVFNAGGYGQICELIK